MVRRHTVYPILLIVTVLSPCVATARTWEVTTSGQLTTALFAARNGDRIHIQAPGPYRAPAGGWHIRRSLEIFGDGPGHNYTDSASVLMAGPSGPVFHLDVDSVSNGDVLQNVYIHDLQLRGGSLCAKPPCDMIDSTRCGILFNNSKTSERGLASLRLARLTINDMGFDGVRLAGQNLDKGAVIGLSMVDCLSGTNRGSGLHLIHATMPRIVGAYFNNNQAFGARITGCNETSIQNTCLEGNQQSNVANATAFGQLFIENSTAFQIEGNHFENFNQGRGNARTAVTVSGGYGGYVGANTFIGSPGKGPSTRGVFVWSQGSTAISSGIVFGPNMWSNTDVLIELDDSPKVTSCTVQQQYVYGTVDANVTARLSIPEAVDRGHIVFPTLRIGPAGSAIHNLTAGIELPRLSTARRDSMTAASQRGARREGLVIYNSSDRGLNHWDGKRWVRDAAFFPSDSTSRNAPPGGIGIPAVLTSQTRNQIPSEFRRKGALIFNTTTGMLNVYDGSNWREIQLKDGVAP